VSGVAIITEACIDVKDRACVDVCPVHVPDGSPKHAYNAADATKGHDHTFFIQHNGAVFAD
jgi:NAD-dependent dihydropyrimidine dehydrogenase PreA subunit